MWSLIILYAASGLPSAVFILRILSLVPADLDNAARIDAAGEWPIFTRVMLALVRPALFIVAIYNIIPIWNDFFFSARFHQGPIVSGRCRSA